MKIQFRLTLLLSDVNQHTPHLRLINARPEKKVQINIDLSTLLQGQQNCLLLHRFVIFIRCLENLFPKLNTTKCHLLWSRGSVVMGIGIGGSLTVFYSWPAKYWNSEINVSTSQANSILNEMNLRLTLLLIPQQSRLGNVHRGYLRLASTWGQTHCVCSCAWWHLSVHWILCPADCIEEILSSLLKLSRCHLASLGSIQLTLNVLLELWLWFPIPCWPLPGCVHHLQVLERQTGAGRPLPDMTEQLGPLK